MHDRGRLTVGDQVLNKVLNDMLKRIPLKSLRVQLALIGIACFLLLGWFATDAVVSLREKHEREALQALVMNATVSIDATAVAALHGAPSDDLTATFAAVRAKLQQIHSVNTKARFVYILRNTAAGIIFLADAEPVTSKDYSPPGQVYGEASPTLKRLFSRGVPFTEGPYKDRWGIWVTGLAPIRNHSGIVVALLAIDIDAHEWRNTFRSYWLVGISMTVLAALLLFLVLGYAEHIIVQKEVIERTQAEETLRLASFPALNPNPIVELDLTGQVWYANPAAQRLFPDLHSQGLAHPFLAGVQIDQDPANNSIQPLHHSQVLVDGRWYGRTLHYVQDGHRVRLYCLDITEQKRGEETLQHLNASLEARVQERTAELAAANNALHQSTHRLRLLKEIASAANMATSTDEVFQVAVDYICGYTGWPVGHVYLAAEDGTGDLVSAPLWHLTEQERYRPFQIATDQTRFSEGQGLPGRILASRQPAWIPNVLDDNNFYRSQTAVELGIQGAFGFPVMVGQRVAGVLEFFSSAVQAPDQELLDLVMQISGQLCVLLERKQAETAVRDSEEQYRSLVDLAPDIIYRLHEDGTIAYISTAISRLGYDAETLVGTPFVEIVHPDDRAKARNGFVEYRVGERRTKDLEIRLLAKHGDEIGHDYELHYRTISLHARGRWDVLDEEITRPEKHFLYTQGIARDISDRKRAEAVLRQSEAHFRSLVEASPIAMIVYTADGQTLMVNTQFSTLFGYAQEEIPDRARWWELAYPDAAYRDTLQTEWHTKLAQADLDHEPMRPRETLITCKDGTTRSIEVHAAAIGDWTFIVYLDLTERKRTEETIRRSEEHFRSLVDTSPIAMAITSGINEQVITLNAQFVRLFGYTLDDVPDMAHWWELAFPDADYRQTIRALWTSRIAKAMTEQSAIEAVEGTITCKDGSTRVIEAHASSIGDWNFIVCIDLTERLAAQSALRKLTRAIEHSSASVVITDRHGAIEYVNPKFCEVTGYTVEEAIGQNPSILNSGLQPAAFYAEMWQAISVGLEWHGEFCNKKKNGELYWESASISAIRDADGAITHYVAVKEDITAQKHAAEELARAKEAAEAANHAKSAFLASMSHEIRTPMNAILGFTQLLARDTSLTEEQRQRLKIIARSGEHLLALINDILDMSKIEAGRVTLVPARFDLPSFLQDMMAMLHVRTEEKGLFLHLVHDTQLPAAIIADEGKLRQVLINLLGNAVKFTRHGGVTLRVGIQGEGPEQQRLMIAVEDTGVGIAPDEQNKLFQSFEQTSSGRLSQEGTGLGLAISQAFVRLMGGEINLESAVNQGSRFAFAIPIVLAESDDLPASPDERRIAALQPGQEAMRILVVDDKETNRQLLAQLLAAIGFRTQEAANGLEAIAQFTAWHPHLILMDVSMPEMDGLEATRRIRAISQGAHIPIIAVTASAFLEDRQIALDAGVDDFLGKPFHEQELLAKIHTHLGVLYQYIEEEARIVAPIDDQVALSHTAVAMLSAELLARIRAAALHGYWDDLLQGIAEVEQQNPRLADELRMLAEQYDYGTLIDLCSEDGAQPHE